MRVGETKGESQGNIILTCHTKTLKHEIRIISRFYHIFLSKHGLIQKQPILKLFLSRPLAGSGDTVHTYRTPLMGYTVKTNTTYVQTVDSDWSKSIHQEVSQESKTKSSHDERVEKREYEIELRGACL
jgi:hypothetical protein